MPHTSLSALPGSSTPGSAPPIRSQRPVIIWLICCAAAVFVMALIGAATRLTESGLSITQWQPLTGAIPPLSQEAWERAFALYRETDQYRLMNQGMSMGQFKAIFWWEFIHRFWGRAIGVIVIVPLIVFLLQKRIDRRLGLRLVGIFILGGLQGAIGWWMVKSGLVDRVSVSPYRLAVHLGMAFLLYCLLVWTVLDLVAPRSGAHATPAALRGSLVAFALLVAVTIVSGALVAGTRGGLIYNTIPLMNGYLVPPDYVLPDLGLRNAFENPAAVQLHHRILAITTVIAAFAIWLAGRRAGVSARLRGWLEALAVAAVVQLLLGVSAILLVVPIWLGVAHQAGAMVVLTMIVGALHASRSTGLADQPVEGRGAVF